MTDRISWMDQTISTFSDVALNKISNDPAAFDLKQNYPNPFNSSTLIEFRLSRSDFIELKIFDSRGRTIQTLLNEFLSKGTHQRKFDSSGLVSGFYFYRIKISSGEQRVKKMTLTK